MVEDVLASQRIFERHAFAGSKILSVTGSQIRNLIELRAHAIEKSYPFSSDQRRSYERYAEFIKEHFHVEGTRPETLIKIAATIKNSDIMPVNFRGPVYVWDFGASPNALPQLFSRLPLDIRDKVRGQAINAYDHNNLGDKGDIQWRNANLETGSLFRSGDVVHQGFCIAVSPYLVDPFNFISRIREHLSPTGSVWIAPFINYGRLHSKIKNGTDQWLQSVFGKNVAIEGYGTDRSASLRVTKSMPSHIPVRPVLDLEGYAERYGRQGAPLSSVHDVIADASRHGHAPKLSYILE